MRGRNTPGIFWLKLLSAFRRTEAVGIRPSSRGTAPNVRRDSHPHY